MKTMFGLLSEQALFQHLSQEQIQHLADSARYRRFRAQELVFHDGNLANRFYVILEGEVVLEAQDEQGKRVPFQTAGAGGLLGWSWMFSNSLHRLQARALQPTETIYFLGDRLRQLCDEDHDLGYHLFRQVADVMMQRLQATRQLVLEQGPLEMAASADWRPGDH
jgi:CRP/FNR family transcriptional regulator, cyclic AMP receptor protein